MGYKENKKKKDFGIFLKLISKPSNCSNAVNPLNTKRKSLQKSGALIGLMALAEMDLNPHKPSPNKPFFGKN